MERDVAYVKCILTDIVNKIWNDYSYLGISFEKFESVVMSRIDKYIDDYKKVNGITLKRYLSDRVLKTFKSFINKRLNSDKFVVMLDGFVNAKLKKRSNKEQALLELQKIEVFLASAEYDGELNIDYVIKLIKQNNKLSDIVGVIAKQDFVQNNSFGDNYDSQLIEILVIAYSNIYNINILNEENVQENGDKNKSEKSYSKNHELLMRYSNGDMAARDELIELNLQLVKYIAARYCDRAPDMTLEDLISEGVIGLMTAIDKFDLNRGTKFSTYAVWWIRQSITRSLENSGIIRIPVYMHDKIRKYFNQVYSLTDKLGRTPTINEIIDELGVSRKNIEFYTSLKRDAISLDSSISDDDDKDTEIYNYVPSGEELIQFQVEKTIINNQTINILKEILSERELDVVARRLGLYGEPEMTLQTLANKYCVTRERIRQIESRALHKLKRSKLFKDFVFGKRVTKVSNSNDYVKKENSIEYEEALFKKECFLNISGDTNNSVESSSSTVIRDKSIYNIIDLVSGNYDNDEYFAIYKEYYKYSKEKIDEAINSLSKHEINALIFWYSSEIKDVKLLKKCNKKYNTDVMLLLRKFENILFGIEEQIDSSIIEVEIERNDTFMNEKSDSVWLNKIYDKYKDYTKEQIDVVLSTLDSKEINALEFWYTTEEKGLRAVEKYKSEHGIDIYLLIRKIGKNLKKYVETGSLRVKTSRLVNNSDNDGNININDLEGADTMIINDNITEMIDDENTSVMREDIDIISLISNKYSEFSKEQVSDIYNSLSEEQKNAISFWYTTLERGRSVVEKYKLEHGIDLYALDRKIKDSLKKLSRSDETTVVKKKRKTKKDLNLEQEIVNDNEKDLTLPNSVLKDEKNTGLEVITDQEVFGVDNCKPSSMTYDEYINLLEIFKKIGMDDIFSTLTPEEFSVALLKFGYYNEIYGSNEYVSNFLKIDKQHVIQIAKKVLLLQKQKLNELIDNAIDIATEKVYTNKCLKK